MRAVKQGTRPGVCVGGKGRARGREAGLAASVPPPNHVGCGALPHRQRGRAGARGKRLGKGRSSACRAPRRGMGAPARGGERAKGGVRRKGAEQSGEGGAWHSGGGGSLGRCLGALPQQKGRTRRVELQA